MTLTINLIDNVPRTLGLTEIIHDVVSSKDPLRTIVQKYAFVHAKDTSRILHLDYDQVSSEGFHGDFHYTPKFPWVYNPSFSLMIYPRETRTIAEKVEMLQEHGYDVGEQVKSLIFTDGTNNYMITVSGQEKADIEKVKFMLGLGQRTEDGKVAFYRGDVQEITGRHSGALSPLIYNSLDKRGDERQDDGRDDGSDDKKILTVYVARNLLVGYSKPQYHIVLDKRSALVVSDMRDMIDILGGIPGFPIIMPFHNDRNMIS